MNPFILFSKKGIEFYKKYVNNLLIYDPSLSSKDKLRKPHVVEKSLLLAKLFGVFNHDEIGFWNPERDGSLRDYDWSRSGEK